MNKKNTFEEFAISDEIIVALTSLRYFHPTKVQEEVIPVALEGKDVIAPNWSGQGEIRGGECCM